MRLVCLGLLLSAGCTYRSSQAEDQAQIWLAENYSGWGVNNVQCKWQDSDGDGYVRCNVSVTNPTSGDISTPPLECTYGFVTWYRGCQVPKGSR